MNYNWNWHIFFEPNPTGAGTYLDMLVSGLLLTIKTALLAWVIALIVGTIIGILRSLPSKAASWIGFCYVEFFRNMPLLVQLFLWFFVLPEILPSSWGLYSPTAWDWATFIGTIGLFLALMFLFIRFLPMISIFELRTLLPQAEVKTPEEVHA